MRAIGIHQSLPITNPESLQDVELPTPEELGPRDLLVHCLLYTSDAADE